MIFPQVCNGWLIRLFCHAHEACYRYWPYLVGPAVSGYPLSIDRCALKQVGILMNPRHLYILRHGSESVAVWQIIEGGVCNHSASPCALHDLLLGQGLLGRVVRNDVSQA